MKLSEFKKELQNAKAVNFVQPNGSFVPRHFHVTEAGLVTKHFIDCGGTVRSEKVVNLQLWTSTDIEHRLVPQKLLSILALSEKLFGSEDLELEVEYQTETIGKYGIELQGENFVLTTKSTNCLALDACGIPDVEKLETISSSQSCCAPSGNCC